MFFMTFPRTVVAEETLAPQLLEWRSDSIAISGTAARAMIQRQFVAFDPNYLADRRRFEPKITAAAVAIVAANDFDHFGFFKNTEMAAEIAVGERAELLEVVEGQAFGIGDERRENAEPRALVNDTVEAFVGETSFAAG